MYDEIPQEPDQMLNCVDCHVQFPFSNGELAFYQGKGLQIPKRCKACRIAKKARQNGGAQRV